MPISMRTALIPDFPSYSSTSRQGVCIMFASDTTTQLNFRMLPSSIRFNVFFCLSNECASRPHASSVLFQIANDVIPDP